MAFGVGESFTFRNTVMKISEARITTSGYGIGLIGVVEASRV
jgi:hypothetical protein